MGCKQSKAGRAGAKGAGEDGAIASNAGTGSKVHIYKQDPTNKIGYRTAWIAEEIKAGPYCSDVYVVNDEDVPEVVATDHSSNYLYDPVKNPDEFDAVNCLATVYRILHMYRRALKSLNVNSPLHWFWGEEAINVLPHAGEDTNAFYVRDYHALCFFYYKDPYRQQVIYSGRSQDVIAHVTGNAILDSLQPGFMESKNAQTRALHESFGDLTAIYALLDQMDMCEAVVAESKGNLHDKSFLAAIGEEFGSGIGRTYGLRNADPDVTMSDVTEEYHDLSRVFTGAVYSILVEIYELTRDLEHEDPAETLFKVARHMCAVTLVALTKVPKSASFKDVANAMIKVEKISRNKTIMKNQFQKRQIYDAKVKQKSSSKPASFLASGTMKVLTDDKMKDSLHQLLGTKKLHMTKK